MTGGHTVQTELTMIALTAFEENVDRMRAFLRLLGESDVRPWVCAFGYTNLSTGQTSWEPLLRELVRRSFLITEWIFPERAEKEAETATQYLLEHLTEDVLERSGVHF